MPKRLLQIPKNKINVEPLLRKDKQGKRYRSHSDKNSKDDYVIGRKSNTVLEQELILLRKHVEKWRYLANKYYKEKTFLMKQLRMSKTKLLYNLLSFRVLTKIINFFKTSWFYWNHFITKLYLTRIRFV